MIQIAVINESTVVADADVRAMLAAFDEQWNKDLAPVWGIEAASFEFVERGLVLDPAAWQVVFLDDSDQAGALAYHDLTNAGLPISKVFATTIIEDKASVSVGATHEICEMAVDPWLNGAYQDAAGTFWASEICDPVEDDKYGYMIGDILVTDFVTQAWYATENAREPIDFQKHAASAFEVLPGGYAQKFDAARGWVQITGPQAMKRHLSAPYGSRRERRMRGRKNWYRSEATR